jgi:hypothetical protein
MARRLIWRGLLGALLLSAAAASTAGARATAAAADFCSLYAPSTAAIESAIGAGDQAPISERAFCYVEGESAQLRIYPYPAGKAKATQAFALTVFEGKKTVTTHPAHLGKGAAMVYQRAGGQIDVFFKRGAHFFVITGDGAKPAQMVAFARAVYSTA